MEVDNETSPITTIMILLCFQNKRTKRLRRFNPPQRDNPLPDLRSLCPSFLEHLQPAFPRLWLPAATAGDPHSCEQFRQTHRYWHHEWCEGRCYDICQWVGTSAIQGKFCFSYLIVYFVDSSVFKNTWGTLKCDTKLVLCCLSLWWAIIADKIWNI